MDREPKDHLGTLTSRWKRRRLVRNIIAVASLAIVALARHALENVYGQSAVLLLMLGAGFDSFVAARRELERASTSGREARAFLRERELRELRWAEGAEYFAALIVVIGFLRHPLGMGEQISIAASLGGGLFVRFGLRKWAAQEGGSPDVA